MTNSNWIYGVPGSDGGHIDTANTERGAKNKATRDGYTVITRRHDRSWVVETIAHKRGGRWCAGAAPVEPVNTGRIVCDLATGVDYPLFDAPLWWHEKGLQQTASGYGLKLTTRYKVLFAGRFRRVYCTQISNAGSLWVSVGGVKHFLN